MHWLSLYVCVCGGEGGGYVQCIGYKPVRVCVCGGGLCTVHWL